MKRIVVLILACMLLLSACGAQPKPEPTPEPTPEKQPEGRLVCFLDLDERLLRRQLYDVPQNLYPGRRPG